MNNIEFRKRLKKLFDNSEGKLTLIEKIVSGQMSKRELQQVGIKLYAEAKSALQVKIPERIRLVPMEAGYARKMWCRTLSEESGGFEPGKDHASLIGITCRALNVSQEQLDEAYINFLPTLTKYRKAEPSMEITIQELTRMYIEEAALAREANRIGDALRDKYGVTAEEALHYFRLHAVVDIKHSTDALREIVRYASSVELQEIAFSTAVESLKNFPIWLTD